MSFVKTICASIVLTTFGAGSLPAQSLRQAQTPAEFPPASYKGTQYVDSRGCVYIRAGVDGSTTWVPRVSQSREPVCGQTPTQVDGTTANAPLPRVAEQVTPAAGQTATPPAVAPRPRPVTTARAPRPASTPAPRVGVAATVAPAASVAAPPRQTGAAAPRPNALSLNTRVVPAHVAAARQGRTAFTVPEGYRAAWTDDRLNPRRAEGTLAGWQAMDLVWTNSVPRRLVDRSSGQDVTASAPLVYPFTDVATQEVELGTVTLRTVGGQVVKKVRRNPGAPSVAELAARVQR